MDGQKRASVGLVSSPGSGNTWLRAVLEAATGICTGEYNVLIQICSSVYACSFCTCFFKVTFCMQQGYVIVLGVHVYNLANKKSY